MLSPPLITPTRDEWLHGWDPTPGIVSVVADSNGTATLWRRNPGERAVTMEQDRFRPWLLLQHREDLSALESDLGPSGGNTTLQCRELGGTGELRFLVSAPTMQALLPSALRGAARRLGLRRVRHVRDLPDESIFVLPPEEQYLVASGRTYFRGLTFDDLRRLQMDIETTGLDARVDRVFMIAVRSPDEENILLEAPSADSAGEADLLRQLERVIARCDPDVIENHNLHGFDLPFLHQRARSLGIPLSLGRVVSGSPQRRAARRGMSDDDGSGRRYRLLAPGRELIDTMDAVARYDFATRALPSHGLKAVAKHLGFARGDREYIRGSEIYRVYASDPDRVRRYASHDVEEVAELSRMLGGAAFALAQMVPRRYERLADAGAATGVIDPLMVRAYLRSHTALPLHGAPSGTVHSGAALHLFASGVAHRVVKADVASLYPSLMCAFQIGPERDTLGVLLSIVDELLERRLGAKGAAKLAQVGSAQRHQYEATSAAMKLVINTAYGYLAAGPSLTRFADVHAANEVTRRGREILAVLCREFAARGVQLLEADTDGVFFSVPQEWSEEDERRVVRDVGALLPARITLEFEGRYQAMLSHEPKNYALLGYDGALTLRGVAFRSSRAEPFGEAFLRQALQHLLVGDIRSVRATYVRTIDALLARTVPTEAVTSRVRLTKSSDEYRSTRDARREFPYEAMLASGFTNWRAGHRARVYRALGGTGRVYDPTSDEHLPYDAEYYVRVLRANFASRLARALTPEAFETVFSDGEQLPLFVQPLEAIQPILTPLSDHA